MAGFYINVSVRTTDSARVCAAVIAIFESRGFSRVSHASASIVADDEDALPDGDDWYGVIVSGATRHGWVSVYVDDWQDSGLLATDLCRQLRAPILEIWVAEDVHWGYTFYEDGGVRDRFADDPSAVAETPEEAQYYEGHAEALAAILKIAPDILQQSLKTAQADAGQFAGSGVDALAQAVGLPFEHVFTGYEFFFDDDPADYGPSLEGWAQFQHLAFRPPPGRETLAE